MKEFTIIGEDIEISDGYHTMRELYQHRMMLFVALTKVHASSWKSKLHSDGTMFEGYFIVGIGVIDGHQISYHYKTQHWNLFECLETHQAPKYDGHTSEDVLNRLMKLRS